MPIDPLVDHASDAPPASANAARRPARHVARLACWAAMAAIAGPATAATPAPTTSRPAPATRPQGDRATTLWVEHVAPLMQRSCVGCHGESKQKGGLDLRRPQAVFAGGTDGSVVIPGRPADSPLYTRLEHGAEGHMPPEKAKEPQLAPEEAAVIREWIAALPTGDDRPSTAGGRDWNPAVPTLTELAAKVTWSPPAGLDGSAAVDHLIRARWRERGVTGAGVCDDRAFVRRAYLDLAGRIPTSAEVDKFVCDGGAGKRAALVDRLLAGDEYPRHLAEVLDAVLLGRKGQAADAARAANGWTEYLRSAVAANRPWSEVVADLIVARPSAPDRKGAVWFLYEKKGNHQAMAEAVAPVAFGVQVACAQCHNHPLAHEIKQQEYWGLVAAFNRSANADGSGGPGVSESAVGGFVNFTNLKKESQPAALAFPNGRTVAEDRPADGAKEQDADDKYVVPPGGKDAKGRPRTAAVPKFSRRQALADAVTRDNPLLARAFVNRTWALLVGRGIVDPVDQMDSAHPPSHPELLSWLAADFERGGYDVRRLIRTIVLSDTYQLDSAWAGSGPPPAADLFARGLEKPLTAEVLYRSLRVAAGGQTGGGSASAGSAAADVADPLRQALLAAFPSVSDRAEYNPTLQQAMFLTNNPLVDALLRPGEGNLTARLLAEPSNEARVRWAFAAVLGRSPDDAERAAAGAFLDARADRAEAGVRQMVWALLSGPEFLTNH